MLQLLLPLLVVISAITIIVTAAATSELWIQNYIYEHVTIKTAVRLVFKIVLKARQAHDR
jgi:predicted nucleic acid-binding protein